MHRYICPSCGASFNGKRCTNCLYEPFNPEAYMGMPAQDSKRQEGDKSTSNRKKMRQGERFRWQEREKKRNTRLPKWAEILICAYLAYNALSPVPMFSQMETEVSETLPEISEFETNAELPAPVFPVSDETVVLNEDDILITAGWPETGVESGNIPLLVRNDSNHKIIVSVDKVTVNGCMTRAWQYKGCVEAGNMGITYIRLDWDELAKLGIGNVTELAFCVEVSDSFSSEAATADKRITLRTTEVNEWFATDRVEDSLVWSEHGISLTCQGIQGEDISEASLLFLVENMSDSYIQLYSADCYVNGEPADLYLCCQVMPGTKAQACLYLNGISELGIESIDQIRLVQCSFGAFDMDTKEQFPVSPPYELEINH